MRLKGSSKLPRRRCQFGDPLCRPMAAEGRRAFLQRYSCYLPTDFVQGLGTLAPLATLEVPDFDSQLPEIDVASVEGPSGQAMEASGAAAAASSSPRLSVNTSGQPPRQERKAEKRSESAGAVGVGASEPPAEPKAVAKDPPETEEAASTKEDDAVASSQSRIAELEVKPKLHGNFAVLELYTPEDVHKSLFGRVCLSACNKALQEQLASLQQEQATRAAPEAENFQT
ncbi:hypothetical protein AK812_SmicGene29377 [Symbiodinium microadriaticum]|uniref:Uncharacterized protein n=1 Tax=Symbiodinium microadriaticum TaxID=2951 RepID=A0A1Q9D213_SYMMI|nr:hypothetical protein AK812_SmicGene29377 [Symbiodinium microadriaticum]